MHTFLLQLDSGYSFKIRYSRYWLSHHFLHITLNSDTSDLCLVLFIYLDPACLERSDPPLSPFPPLQLQLQLQEHSFFCPVQLRLDSWIFLDIYTHRRQVNIRVNPLVVKSKVTHQGTLPFAGLRRGEQAYQATL